MPNIKDLTGQRYGMLLVLRLDEKTKGTGRLMMAITSQEIFNGQLVKFKTVTIDIQDLLRMMLILLDKA